MRIRGMLETRSVPVCHHCHLHRKIESKTYIAQPLVQPMTKGKYTAFPPPQVTRPMSERKVRQEYPNETDSSAKVD